MWLPPVGKETHRDSGSLPPTNIYITHSPSSVAQGGFFRGSLSHGRRTCRKLIVHEAGSWPVQVLSCLLGAGVIDSVFDHVPRGNRAVLFLGQADSSALPQRTREATTGPLAQMSFHFAQLLTTSGFDSFTCYHSEMLPINVRRSCWGGGLITTPFRQTALHGFSP